MDALIGWSGFVGSTLLKQRSFDRCYRSSDIADIRGKDFKTIICAGAPAQKWIADTDPAADKANIDSLAALLATVRAEHFILISTVDVFSDSRGATESTSTPDYGLSPYGSNRLWLEQAVAATFAKHLIVRLPGLVGPGLRKNAVFDFHNDNNLHSIDARAVYQFYPMVNLWSDLETASDAQLRLVHLTSAPVSVKQLADDGFGRAFDNQVESRAPANYDLRTQYSALFGGSGEYTYSQRESLLAVRAYGQSEPHASICS